MANVIDAFLVTMGLDGSAFVSGANDIRKAESGIRESVNDTNNEERRVDGEREQRTKKTVEGYRKIRNEVLGLFAIFTAGRGIKNFIGDTIDQAASLGFLAENLQVSTQEITAWQRASERAGGSAEGITQQLKQSADTLAQLNSGLGPTGDLQWFFRLGGGSDDLKDGNTYLLARAKIVQEMFSQSPTNAALAARNLGILDDQFDFIKQGPSAILALVEAQKKNAAITEQDAAAALTLKNQWLDLTQSLQATTIKLLVTLMPAFTKIIGEVEKLTRYLTDNKDVVAGWADAIVKFDWSSIARDAKSFAGDIKTITENVRELIDTWKKWTDKDGKIPTDMKGVSQVIGKNVFDPQTTNNDVQDRKKTSQKGVHGEELPTIQNTLREMWARTLASLGSKDAAEYVRDTTGRDDYGVGPKRASQPAPNAPKGGSRGIRNNNPGNLEYGDFARNYGSPGADANGRFARFNSPQDGLNAMAALLKSYGDRGINSINAIVSRYAPGNENNTQAYSASLSKQTGFAAGVKLDLNDPRVLQPLVAAMIQQENGSNPYNADMLRRATGYNPTNAAAQVQGAARQPAQAPKQGSTTTVTNNIDKVEIRTQATDAAGIARDIRPELGRLSFPNQASSGVRQ